MDAPFQFTDCDFCMNPASRIVSVAKGLAFLSGTRLHHASCKNQAWYGIEVQRGTILGNGASFRGAYNAIRTPAGSTHTPTYQFTDCQFYRNYIGMNIASPVTFGAFSGNTFGLDAGVEPWPGLGANACSWVTFIGKPALLRPFAGIYAETPANSANVVTVNLPDLALGPNVFINLSNGIYLNDANAIVRQCRFQNMIPGAYFQGNKGDDGFGVALFTNHTRNLQQWGLGKTNALLTFDNCLHAVYADLNPQMSGGNVLLMSGNNNMNVAHGYTLDGAFATFRFPSVIQNNNVVFSGGYAMLVQNAAPASRLRITRNRVSTANTEGTGILLLNYAPQALDGDYRVSVLDNADDATHDDGIFGGADGVAMGNVGNTLVENNTVSDFARIGINNVNSPESDIRCNTVSGAPGVEAIRNNMSASMNLEYNHTDASNRGIEITSACNNTIIRCNTIGSHDIGLFYDAAAETGPELPGGLSAGNIWTGTYSTWAAQFALGGDLSMSPFFYRQGEINPDEISPQQGWFNFITSGITCGAGCPTNQLSGKTVTELDHQIADGTLDPGGLPGYLLKRNLYNDLLYYPGLLTGNAHLQDFYTSYGSANGGKLAVAEKALTDGFRLSALQQTQWDAAQSELLEAFDAWFALDSLVQTGADPDGQTARREALRQQAAAAEIALRAISDANLSARTASVVSIQQTLDNVSPQVQWESNEKTLDNIFLHTAFVDAAPDAAQTDQIEQIAEQCLADGGPAVTRARAWYMALTGTRIEVECGGVIERMAVKQASDSGNLLIYPDPAQTRIAIQFPNPASPGRRLEIVDLTGKLCKVIEVPQEALMAECSIADLPGGYYFCRLSEGEKIIATAKFFVQR